MNVLARFRCTEIKHLATHTPTDVLASLVFIPVYGDGKANESWSKHTPSGELKMNITNPNAIAAFEIGKTYELAFSKVD